MLPESSADKKEISRLQQHALELEVELGRRSALESALRKAMQSLVKNHEVSSALAGARTIREVLDVVVEVGFASVGCRSGSVYLLDVEREVLEVVRAVDHHLPLPRYRLVRVEDELPFAEAVRRGQPLFHSASAACERWPEVRDHVVETGACTLMTIPLVVGGRAIGAFALAFLEDHSLSDDEMAFLTVLAHQCSLALDRARLYEAERAARARAESADRKKDEFLAMLGHELRNPLAPILTALDLMKRRGNLLREEQIIQRQVEYLVRLVDDLLDVSRVTTGKIELKKQRVDVAEVLTEAIEMASPLFERRAHSLVVDAPRDQLFVEADLGRLAQVFANLLTNAAKYTDAGGLIEVRAQREGDEVIVSVRDNGVGIVPDVLPHIFLPFVQGARNLDQSQGGLGLGLALAKNFVDAHGGTIEAYSEGSRRGTEMIVRLPWARPSESADKRHPAPARDSGLARVLVVDDNVDAADMLAEVLRDAGHEVAVAYDGPRALDVARAFHPDVALLDIGLPVMDGYELARRLRDGGLVVPRVIAVSGYGQERDKAKSKEAGFDLHLVKPIDLDELFTALAANQPSASG